MIIKKTCARCGGTVEVAIVEHQRPDGTVTTSAEGRCQGCGLTFDEEALLKLEGPGPVGG
jgi:Fe-S cluster biogenesis protein NfuA